MKVIGLTGGIASGKSTVSSILKQLGAVIIDADVLARLVVQPGEKAYTEIVQTFGRQILQDDMTIDRKKLADQVFSSPLLLKKLNAIVHPEVIGYTKKMLEEFRIAGKRVAVIDAPLLIEAGMEVLADEVWLVIISPDIQLSRAMARDNTSSTEAQARIDAQMPQEEKIRFATRIIDNSGTLEETTNIIKNYYQEIISE